MSTAPSEHASGQVEIPAAFTAFHILPKDEGEFADGRMPKDLAHAMMVFLSTNINDGENGRKCYQCVNSCLKLFAQGPSGNQKVSVGQAILCWNCGTAGLPKNVEDFPPTKVDGKMPPYAICVGCSESEETNFIEIRQPDGTVVPFIESAFAPGLSAPDNAPADSDSVHVPASGNADADDTTDA